MKHKWRSRKIKKSYNNKTKRQHKGGAPVAAVQTINVNAEPITVVNMSKIKTEQPVFLSIPLDEKIIIGKKQIVNGNPTGNKPMLFKLALGGKSISIQFPGESKPNNYVLELPSIQLVGPKQYYISRNSTKYYLFKPISTTAIFNVDLNKAIRSSIGEKMKNISNKINPVTKIKAKYESIKKKFNGIIDPFSDKELDALGTIISNNNSYKKRG